MRDVRLPGFSSIAAQSNQSSLSTDAKSGIEDGGALGILISIASPISVFRFGKSAAKRKTVEESAAESKPYISGINRQVLKHDVKARELEAGASKPVELAGERKSVVISQPIELDGDT